MATRRPGLTENSGLMDEAPCLAGKSISLADLHAAPMFAVFRLAPVRISCESLMFNVKSELKHWLRKLGFYRILNRFR